MKIDIKVFNNSGGNLPTYATEGSACVDVYVPKSFGEYTMRPGETKIIPTGLFVSIPYGYELQIRSRSGLAINKQIIVLNSPGTIDSDYRGEIGVILHNSSNKLVSIKSGERIAQMALCPICEINWVLCTNLDKTERDNGGFGSTGTA